MSARGSLVAKRGARSWELLAEATSQIPLFWLSFLSVEDIDRAEEPGAFEIDRKQSLERATSSLPFFVKLFPEVVLFEEMSGKLLKRVRSKRVKTIGIVVNELLPELWDDQGTKGMPTFRTAVEAIERRDANYSLTVPARRIKNPFTQEDLDVKERRFSSTSELLLYVCLHRFETLASIDMEIVENAIIGYRFGGFGEPE